MINLLKLFLNPALLASNYLTFYGGIGDALSGGGKDGGGGGQVAPFKPWAVATPVGGTSIAGETVTATLSPELQSFYDMYLQGAREAAPNAGAQAFGTNVGQYGQQMFGSATGMSIPEMSANYYQQQQNLLAPSRAQEEARLADTLFKTGRTGAAVGMGQGYINPEQYALLQAREQQNAQLALGAEDRARQIQNADIQQALSLFGLGEQIKTAPYQTSANILGFGTGLAGLLNNNIGYGMQAGQATQTGNIASAQNAMQGQANSKGLLGGLAQAGATAYKASDRRLKTNIKEIGQYKNGLTKYSWTYLWGQDSEGVMADEAEKVVPSAVINMPNGYKAVNYALIGE
jgi:hypothetical protein